VRDPAGAGLSPDPLGLNTEPLGDFVSCQQPFHPRPLSLGDGAGDRVPGADPDGVLGARVAFGTSAGARWPTGVASLFVVAMTLGSEKWAYLEVLHERAGISRNGSVGPQETTAADPQRILGRWQDRHHDRQRRGSQLDASADGGRRARRKARGRWPVGP